MMIISTESIPGKDFEAISFVQGSVVWSKNIGRDIMAGFKNIVGGEIKSYTDMLTEAREVSLSRMKENAKKLNADAVIGIRFATSSVMAGASELIAYGTAIKFK